MLVDVCMYVDLVGEWEERSFVFLVCFKFFFFHLLCLIRRGLMSMA